MIGGGKYDAECEAVLLALKAHGVLLMVIGGERGSGFSASLTLPLIDPRKIPEILRNVADQIEGDVQRADYE